MTDSNDRRVWLLIIRSSDVSVKEHILKPGISKIGREFDNEIVLPDASASSHHAEINYDFSTNLITIHDQKSTNGTFVNGKRINNLHTLQNEDQIRIGRCLISLINTDKQTSTQELGNIQPTKVTGELILESIDQYGILLHEIGKRLVNMPELSKALLEISELIKRMIGAEECHVLLKDKFDNLGRIGVSASLWEKIVESQSATIFSNGYEEVINKKEPTTKQLQSKLLVPVIINQNVVAIIFAKKSQDSPTQFNNSDLQLALAVSHQVALSIQRSHVEGKLIHNSNHDSLTDLPNRDFFIDQLHQTILRVKQEQRTRFAVLFIDIDDFKLINDSLGHSIGDKLLIAVAERLKHNVRKIDIVTRNSVIARFGGDEFAILLDDVDEDQFAISAANRLIDILSNPYNIVGKQIFISVSIGVALNTIGYETPEDILRDADMAMYQAKEMGKSRVEVYDKTMHARVSERMQMGTALRQGALYKEFRLHYQPIVSLKTGQYVGYEALVRWHTRDKGILVPSDFMDAIDTTDLTYSVDHWVLKTACKQAIEWSEQFPKNPSFFISVNLSAKNIKHPNLIDNIKKVLQETKLSPSRLFLEVTEKVSAPDDQNTIEVLAELRSLGIRISLDDFGSGYSALNYLAKFPVDALKIDRSIMKMIEINEDSQKIVEMVIALANHLKLKVIAEGVEKINQVNFLNSNRCEYAQGFFFSKPLQVDSVTKKMMTGK